MERTASHRITAAAAGALMALGIMAGGELGTSQPRYLADYGSSITAQNSEEQARSEGVPHMSDRQHSGAYFKRMNGER